MNKKEIIRIINDSKLNSKDLLELVEESYKLWNVKSVEEGDKNENEDYRYMFWNFNKKYRTMVAISQCVETGLFEYTSSRLDDIEEIKFKDSFVDENTSPVIIECLLKMLKIITVTEDQIKGDIGKCNLELTSKKRSN